MPLAPCAPASAVRLPAPPAREPRWPRHWQHVSESSTMTGRRTTCMPTTGDGHYEVVWPRSERRSELRPLAPRRDSLRGVKVAQLWDYLFRGDEVFTTLEAGLRERHPDIEFVSWREFGNTHGEDEARVLAELPQ